MKKENFSCNSCSNSERNSLTKELFCNSCGEFCHLIKISQCPFVVKPKGDNQ